MGTELDTPNDAVYQRTEKGLMVATARASLIAPKVLSLLRLVNGFTPASVIVKLIRSDPREAQEMLAQLASRGLIEAVDPAAALVAMQARRASINR